MRKFKFFTFNQEKLLEKNISLQETIILEWAFFHFNSSSDKLVRENKEYFWVDYTKIRDDLPILKIKDISRINEIFENLCKLDVLEKTKIFKDGRWKVYYRFKDSEDNMKLIEAKNKEQFSFMSPVENIVEKLLSMKKQDDSPLFTKFDIGKSFKYMKKIQTYILKIYEGRFSREYQNNDDFYKKNEESIDLAKVKIREAKNDWKKVEEIIIEAAENYKLWFEPAYIPMAKDWLQKYKNLAVWFWNEYGMESMFMACLGKKPSLFAVQLADDKKDNLPEKILSLAKQVQAELFPSLSEKEEAQYWNAIESCLKAERNTREAFDDYMVHIILGNDGDYVLKYLSWLPEAFGEKTKEMLKVWHVGSNGLAWKKWIDQEKDWGEENIKEYLTNVK